MTTKGNIQYFADTLLIEKILTIEEGLTKEAGLVDMFRGVASAIQQQVSERVKNEGVSGALVTYLAPAVLGRIWAPLGIVTTLASAWGFSVGSMMNSVLNGLRPKLEAGEQVTLDEINSIGKAAAQGEIGETMNAEAGDDMLFYLRKIEAEGKLTRLVRNAQLGRAYNSTPWLKGQGGVLGRIFGTVGKLKGKWLLAGIIIWFIKTVLIGAGLVEGTQAVSKVVGINPETKEKDETSLTGFHSEDEPEIVRVNLPQAMSHNLKPSGQGLQYHQNDESSMWIVPLVGNNMSKTLLSWTLSIYPELKGYEKDIISSSSFNNLVSLLSKGIDPESPGYLVVPQGLHSRKDIVDRFVAQVASKINRKTDEP
jgi:hypothetical protein